MTRIVGHQNRSEFILDPVEALRRGAILDQMGPNLLPPGPSGVQCTQTATHAGSDYGGVQMWEPMQAELDIAQAIAMQFSAHLEIQWSLARCLLISITKRNKQGLNIQEEENSPFATPTKVSVPFNYAAVPPNPYWC